MAIHWQVKFKSLRADELYTVNIYDDNYYGSPIQLKGAAQPFITQEDSNEDFFAPIRTQSGYIRIVDDGTINWRSIIPTTDVDRPVILTNGNGGVMWQGFMQAQNFGSAMFDMPQEREFPVQCVLSIISRYDINKAYRETRNFASVIYEILESIPSVCRPQKIVFQGGYDAKSWLLKKIDMQNMVDEDSDAVLQGKYDLMQCLEYVCNFWGWCARTAGNTLYFTCADDNQSDALVLTYNELSYLATGYDAGSVETMMTALSIGGIFASTNNTDFQMRGPNSITYSSNANTNDGELLEPMDDRLRKEMTSTSWQSGYQTGDVHYSQDVVYVSRNYFYANAFSSYGSFNVASKRSINTSDPQLSTWNEVGNVIHLKHTSDRSSTFVQLVCTFEHFYDNGFFRLWGDVYVNGERLDTTEGRWYAGNADMWMRFGIGNSRASAMWWDGKEWGNSETIFRATIGNKDTNMFTRWWTGSVFDTAVESNIINVSGLSGYIYLDFLGTDSTLISEIDGEKVIDIKDFCLQFTKNDSVSKYGPYPNSGWYDIQDADAKSSHVYKSTNNNQNIREERSIDNIWASDNKIEYGFGIVANDDGTYMETAIYGSSDEHPEQHFVDRIANYYNTSKRKIDCELLAHDGTYPTVADAITPRNTLSIDGTTMYPVSISRDWRDDIVNVTLLEL